MVKKTGGEQQQGGFSIFRLALTQDELHPIQVTKRDLLIIIE